MVVNHCSEILTRRLGKEIRPKSDKLSDIFRQVAKIYQKRASIQVDETTLSEKAEKSEDSLLQVNVVEGILRDKRLIFFLCRRVQTPGLHPWYASLIH